MHQTKGKFMDSNSKPINDMNSSRLIFQYSGSKMRVKRLDSQAWKEREL